MATKVLTSKFEERFGMTSAYAYSLSEDAQYIIMSTYSDSEEWFVMGAVSCMGALNKFLKAIRYSVSYRSDMNMYESENDCTYHIQSTRTGREIILFPCKLYVDDYTVEAGCIVTMPANTIGHAVSVISEFGRQEKMRHPFDSERE